ncbi:uncharacterized protein LOC130445235 [Diorhabda sublineata]|uniref:uncharacterized protein LOC130445235 n=1 Tax=Diorhabda sublineata TaxID=1163346 RepID=UPI0024E0BC90|nr:uncharacterized protein LOC130445235 [Diorhabda sublineata]
MSSTSLYCNPIGLLSKTTPHIYKPDIKKVKRVLFEPVDHIATQKFVEEELEKIRVTKSKEWNFDFENERSLSPNGDFQWKPATPVKNRPIKYPLVEFTGHDLYAFPDDVIRPIPIKATTPKDEMTSSRKNHARTKPQRLITDFMSVKKRSTSDFTKKMDWIPAMERPTKLPRLSELSS